MTQSKPIPEFALFGESGSFPDVVHCEQIRDRARLHDWVISPHRHGHMAQVLHLHQGRAEARVDFQQITLEHDDFIYVPPHVVHGFEFRRGSVGLVLSLPLPVLQSLAPETGKIAAGLSRPITGQADERLHIALAQLSSVFKSSGTYRAQAAYGLAHVTLAAVAEIGQRDRTSPDHARFTRFETVLETHLTRDWGPGDFAAALSITPGHLNRICQAARGKSASQVIEERLMTEACRLLAFTRLAVADIGYQLGYADAAYFSRRFRVVTGQSPSDYRARFHSDAGAG